MSMEDEGNLIDPDQVPIVWDACVRLTDGLDSNMEMVKVAQISLHVHIGDDHMEPVVFLPEPIIRGFAQAFDVLTTTSERVHLHVTQSGCEHAAEEAA